jgi:putative membrane protein insertion efficiency factor
VTKIADLHKKWMKDPEYRREYEGLDAEFALAPAIIATRAIGKAVAKAPIHAYRWTLKPLIGWECRHLPTCSEYALGAIDRNGAWRGAWLALSRICRCHPWGTHGFDPVPDIAAERHPLAPWRYGRWGWRGPAA